MEDGLKAACRLQPNPDQPEPKKKRIQATDAHGAAKRRKSGIGNYELRIQKDFAKKTQCCRFVVQRGEAENPELRIEN